MKKIKKKKINEESRRLCGWENGEIQIGSKVNKQSKKKKKRSNEKSLRQKRKKKRTIVVSKGKVISSENNPQETFKRDAESIRH